MSFAHLAAIVINLRIADFSQTPVPISIPNLRNVVCPADRAPPDRDLRCRLALAGTLPAGLELGREGKPLLSRQEPWPNVQVHTRRSLSPMAADRAELEVGR
jgi:hypothetical protein